MSKEAMKEGIELILFYEQRGADWTVALAYHLNKALFGERFSLTDRGYQLHKRQQARAAKQAKEQHETQEESSAVLS